MRNAVAIPPIKRHEMVLAWTQTRCGRVVRSKVFVDALGARKRPDEPGQGIAKAGLTRFITPEAGEHTVTSHAFNSGRQGPLLVIEEEEDRRGAECTDERPGLDCAGRGHDDMGINHCDGDDRFPSDSCSLTPIGGERSRRGTNRLGSVHDAMPIAMGVARFEVASLRV